MSYIINTATGSVIRVSDGVQVAPSQSTDDPNYLAYLQWINEGNQPEYVSIPSAPAATRITKFAFRNRFTTAEKVALELATLDNPSAPVEQRQLSAMLRVFMKDLENAQFIILDRQDIVQGIQQLVFIGILTSERATEILSTPPTAEELA